MGARRPVSQRCEDLKITGLVSPTRYHEAHGKMPFTFLPAFSAGLKAHLGTKSRHVPALPFIATMLGVTMQRQRDTISRYAEQKLPSRGFWEKVEESLVYGCSQTTELTSYPDHCCLNFPAARGHHSGDQECRNSCSEVHYSQEIETNLFLAACEGGLHEGQDKTHGGWGKKHGVFCLAQPAGRCLGS